MSAIAVTHRGFEKVRRQIELILATRWGALGAPSVRLASQSLPCFSWPARIDSAMLDS